MNYAEASRTLSALLVSRGEEWAGLPMPIPHLTLTVEPKNPWIEKLKMIEAACHAGEHNAPDERGILIPSHWDRFPAAGAVIRNFWYSTRLRQSIVIWQDPDGRITWGVTVVDRVKRFQFVFDTMAASIAWTLETELTAMEKLATYLPSHLYNGYILTGTIVQTSKRSGVTYLFRRCRPTLAFRDDRLLCALCLHPTGYYEGTFAGSLCPTDDVIAHLLLMRADEPMFWRRANQHSVDRPESGL